MEQVTDEAVSLKQSLDKYFLRNQKMVMEAKERVELLGRAICNPFFWLGNDNRIRIRQPKLNRYNQ